MQAHGDLIALQLQVHIEQMHTLTAEKSSGDSKEQNGWLTNGGSPENCRRSVDEEWPRNRRRFDGEWPKSRQRIDD